MATFKDKADRGWVVELDVPTIKRLESRVPGFKIDGLLTEGGLFALFSDAPRFVDVLWVLCEPQAKAAGIEQEAFAEALPRRALDDAGDALVRAVADFTPRHLRPAMQALVARLPEVEAEINREAIARLSAVTLSAPATGAAGSSGSTPAPPG